MKCEESEVFCSQVILEHWYHARYVYLCLSIVIEYNLFIRHLLRYAFVMKGQSSYMTMHNF